MKGDKVTFARFGQDICLSNAQVSKQTNKGNVKKPTNSNHTLPVVQKISISYYYYFL